MNIDNPPPSDSSSDITYSSRSSNSSSSDNVANQQIIIHAGLEMGLLTNNQMGEGLLNIAQAYLDEEEEELEGNDFLEENTQQVHEEEHLGENNDDDFQLLEDVNIVPPQEAHLIIGKIETHFFSVPEEHDLTKRFSKQGMQI
jgi:hypothetical protein